MMMMMIVNYYDLFSHFIDVYKCNATSFKERYSSDTVLTIIVLYFIIVQCTVCNYLYLLALMERLGMQMLSAPHSF